MNAVKMREIKQITQVLNHIEGMELVIFDLDDTLYNECDYVISGFSVLSETILSPIPKGFDKLVEAWKLGLPAIDVVVDESRINHKDEIKQEAIKIYREHFPKISISEETRDLLKLLSERKILLGLITDGRPEGQRNKIKALKIEKYFSSIIITDELGGVKYRKPCDLAFRKMRDYFALSFDKMCYVGDNMKKDFIAPEQLGMRSIYFKNTKGLYYEG